MLMTDWNTHHPPEPTHHNPSYFTQPTTDTKHNTSTMKHTSPIAAFVAVASLALARADGGFLGDGGCSGFQLMGAQGYPSYITATGCNGAGDTTVFIDLNHCLANDGGNLVAQDK